MREQQPRRVRDWMERHSLSSALGGIVLVAGSLQGLVSCKETVDHSFVADDCSARLTGVADASSDGNIGTLRINRITGDDCIQVRSRLGGAAIDQLQLNDLFAACRILDQRGQIGVVGAGVAEQIGFVSVPDTLAASLPKDFPTCDSISK